MATLSIRREIRGVGNGSDLRERERLPVLTRSGRGPSAHGKPLGRRERKKLETRRRIFHTAFELFGSKGFEETTVEEIAEAADVAKGTVFNYFASKLDLLLEAHEAWMERLEEELGLPESWNGHVRGQLLQILFFVADLAIENREVSRLVIFETMREAHFHLAQDRDLNPEDSVRLLEGLVEQVIRGGQERGEIRGDVDPSQAASVVAASAFSTVVRWLVRGGSAREMKTALEAKLDIIFGGLNP